MGQRVKEMEEAEIVKCQTLSRNLVLEEVGKKAEVWGGMWRKIFLFCFVFRRGET